MSTHITPVLHRIGDAPADTLTICLPGILVSDAERFFSPVTPALESLGDVMYVSYANPRGFDGYATTCALADLLEQQASQYAHLNVIGVSLGGMLLATPELAWPLKEVGQQCDLRLLVIDSPSGGQDFYGGLNRLLAKFMRFVPKGKWIERPGVALMSKLLVPPKPHNLEAWEDGADYAFLGDNVTKENRAARTVTYGMKGMQTALESSFRRYVQQLAWMAKFTLEQDALRGHDITYICNDNKMNETVEQPQAADTWMQRTGAFIHVTNGAHAALAEWPQEYRCELSELLARLARLSESIRCRVSLPRDPVSILRIFSYR